MYKRLAVAAIIFGSALICAHAQWVSYPTPGLPRTPDGKPNLRAAAPRTPDGKPDLSGIWQVEPTPMPELKRLFGNLSDLSVPGDNPSDFSKYFINILADFKPGEAPIRPEVAAALRQRQINRNSNASSRCLPGGLPRMYLVNLPFKLIQTPGQIAVLLEALGTYVQIYTDGRKAPTDPQPLWLGYSSGRWNADTLVVDTVGFNDKTTLDAMGHPHSEALHEFQRFRRRDFGHMDIEVTIDDPSIYTRSFTIKFTERLLPDTDILEYFCAENERDAGHMSRQ